MQTYLLAANLFAITALLLGLNDFSKGRQSWRLLPLFLLVISRSLIFILFLSIPTDDQSALPLPIIATLEVFSSTCIVWALINPVVDLPEIWRKATWLAGSIAFFLTMLPLIPGWPIPYQLHSLIILIFGTPLILMSLGQISWIHLAAVLAFAIANFLSLLGLTNSSWLVVLIAYAFFVGALHWESLNLSRERQQVSEIVAQEAINLGYKRQRWLEVSEVISAVPGLDEAMIHLARSMAHVTHSDQSAIFILDLSTGDQAHLAAIYSPERPVDLKYHDQITIRLVDCVPLQAAIGAEPQQVLIAQQSNNISSEADVWDPSSWEVPGFNIEDLSLDYNIAPSSLDSLYSLWNEERSGPTLIQPLTIQGRSIGALVLGNPVTNRIIRSSDQLLCDNLTSQMAVIVEAYRHYADLEPQVEIMSTLETEPVPEAKLEPKPVPTPFVEAMNSDVVQAVTAVQMESAPAVAEIVPSSSSSSTSASVSKLEELDHYLAILETVDDGVVVSNARGRVQLVNRAAERIMGKSRAELVDKPIGTVYGAIDSGEPIEDLAVAFARRNKPLPTYMEDEDRAIQGRLIPWRNVDKEWLGIIAVFRDVTHQVKADKARNNSIIALSRVLRGPLAIIIGYVELITAGSMGDFSEDHLRIQQIIHNSAEKMGVTLDNAMQISMQNKRKLLPKFEEVDPKQVIDEVVYEANSMAQLSELKLILDIKDLPTITADPKHLHRILENLLSNACRFTPPGGQVTLRAWVQQEREHNANRPHLLLAVADNGVGIPQTEHKRIFDPFYQLGNQNPDDKPGLGMGLTVVKELVEWHNGRIWVESMPGAGAIFQVALPTHPH